MWVLMFYTFFNNPDYGVKTFCNFVRQCYTIAKAIDIGVFGWGANNFIAHKAANKVTLYLQVFRSFGYLF